MMLQLKLLVSLKSQSLNIANSKQSLNNPGGSHQRLLHFYLLERKNNGQIKGLISNVWLIL